ncbi:farnesyl pyrophosphate synthase isoform 2-T2 [Vipera latastei]
MIFATLGANRKRCLLISALGFWRSPCQAAINHESHPHLFLPGRIVFPHFSKAVSLPIFRPAKQGLFSRKNMSQGDKHPPVATDKEEFVNYFPQIVRDLLENELHVPEVADAVARLKRVIEYNAVGGKYNRGLTVVAAVRELAKPDQLNPKTFRIALVVGWCVELLQAFFLIADDIMDSSVTRRGRPCWYRQEGIGLDAINDAFLVESSVYQLLRRHCRDQPYYLNLLELFLQTSYQTELGQALDLFPINLDFFTEERYKAIVKHKTAYYSFYLPVAAAMYMAGIDNEEEHAHAKAILFQMGEFFQIQENYGQKETEKINRVKALYEDQDLKAVYKNYEENSYQDIMALIAQHAGRLPGQIFLDLANKIYKRQK